MSSEANPSDKPYKTVDLLDVKKKMNEWAFRC